MSTRASLVTTWLHDVVTDKARGGRRSGGAPRGRVGWGMSSRRAWGFVVACALIGLVALPRPRTGAPEVVPRPDPSPVPSAERAPRDPRPRVGVALPAEPEQLAAFHGCSGFSLAAQEVAREALSAGQVPAWSRWLWRAPPRPVRVIATAVGVRPGDLATRIGDADPWLTWSLARAEEGWRAKERAGLESEARSRRREEDAAAIADLTAPLAATGDPALVELATVDALDALTPAGRGTEVGDPEELLEALLDASRPETRKLAFDRLCAHDLAIDPSDHVRLRRVVEEGDDHLLGVELASFAFRSAWNAGQRAEARSWAPIVEEQQEACRVWGSFGRLASHPALSTPLDELPERYGPAGAEHLAARLAEGAPVSGPPRVDCERFPCLVVAPARGEHDLGAMGRVARRTVGDVPSAAFGAAEGLDWVAALTPPGLLDEADARAAMAWRAQDVLGGMQRRRCLNAPDLAAIRRAVGEPPRTWADALRVAAADCHAASPLAPGRLELTGRWVEGWSFAEDHPLAGCVAERATAAPPSGEEVVLAVEVRRSP